MDWLDQGRLAGISAKHERSERLDRIRFLCHHILGVGLIMSCWSYICPRCGQKIKTQTDRDDIKRLGKAKSLIKCEACLTILQINTDLTVSDFQQILKDNVGKRKAESKLSGKETICVMEI